MAGVTDTPIPNTPITIRYMTKGIGYGIGVSVMYRLCLRYIHSALRRIPKSFVPSSLNDQIVSVVRENVWHQSVPGSFAAGIVQRISEIKPSFASNNYIMYNPSNNL